MPLTKDESKKLLQGQLEEIEKLRPKKAHPSQVVRHEPWRQQTIRVIERIFGEDGPQAKQFRKIEYAYHSAVDKDSEAENYELGLDTAAATLESFIKELDLLPPRDIMKCPKCENTNVTFLEIDEIGSSKYNLALPHIAGAEFKKGKKVAYHRCNSCGAIFYTEPFKS